MNKCQIKGNFIMQELYSNSKTCSMVYHIFNNPNILLAIIVCLFTSSVNAQWNNQSPIPTFLDVRGVGAPTSDHVFIATDDNSFDNGGALFESNDGGVTWVQRNIPFSLNDPFNGLFFLDSQNGWAYGNDNYRTTDGGTTWVQLPFLGSTYFMKFYSTNLGLQQETLIALLVMIVATPGYPPLTISSTSIFLMTRLDLV